MKEIHSSSFQRQYSNIFVSPRSFTLLPFFVINDAHKYQVGQNICGIISVTARAAPSLRPLKCVDILAASVGCGPIVLHAHVDGAAAGAYCLFRLVGVLWHCRNCVVASI